MLPLPYLSGKGLMNLSMSTVAKVNVFGRHMKVFNKDVARNDDRFVERPKEYKEGFDEIREALLIR